MCAATSTCARTAPSPRLNTQDRGRCQSTEGLAEPDLLSIYFFNNTCRYTGDGARLYTGLTSTEYATFEFHTNMNSSFPMWNATRLVLFCPDLHPAVFYRGPSFLLPGGITDGQ